MFQIDDIRNVLQSRAENGASSAAGGLTCIFMIYDICTYHCLFKIFRHLEIRMSVIIQLNEPEESLSLHK